MLINRNGIDFIKSQEGLKQYLYKDDAKNYTIGWGHKVDNDKLYLFEDYKENSGKLFPLPQCETLLNNDLQWVENYLNDIGKEYNLILSYQQLQDIEKSNQEKPIILNQNQFNALCSFCFNTGELNEAMKNRLAVHNLDAVGNAILEYIHDNKGNVEPGLVRRRKAENQLFFTLIKDSK